MILKAYFKESHAHFSCTTEKIIILNETTTGFDNTVFIIIKDENSGREIYSLQIAYEYYCSLFTGVKLWNEFVVIGFDENCYLFNMVSKEITCHKLNSSFNNIVLSDHHVLVCSLSYINCFDKFGHFIFRSEKLGTEYVRISGVVNGIAYGSGDWGEKEGWKYFQFQFSKTHLNSVDREVPKRAKKKGLLSLFKRKGVALF